MSTFRKYGGTQFSAVNNVTHSFISNSEQMNINGVSGQLNTTETFLSNIDMSGNSILHTGTLYFQDGTSISTAGATGVNYWGLTGTNNIQNNNSGNVIIGPTGQTSGTGPNLNVNGKINISGVNNVTTITPSQINCNNLLLQGDNTNAYIKPTNIGSTLNLGNSTQTQCLTIGAAGPNPVINVLFTDFIIQQFDYTVMQVNQLGSQASVTATSPNISTGFVQTLVSVTIPAAGVWLVEGSLNVDLTGCNLYTISLSTTSGIDTSRASVTNAGNFPSNFASHITSVFVLTASTIVKLNGYLLSGASSNNSNTIRYTKIG